MNTKEFLVYWGEFLSFLFLFCFVTHLLLFSSVWYFFLFMISLVWVLELLVLAIIFIDMLNAVDGEKVSRFLFFCGVVLLIIGIVVTFEMDDRTGKSLFSVFSFGASINSSTHQIFKIFIFSVIHNNLNFKIQTSLPLFSTSNFLYLIMNPINRDKIVKIRNLL